MKIGIIGYKGHSKRIIEILKKNELIDQIIVYCRSERTAKDLTNENLIRNIIYTSELEDLLISSGIIISSNNESHVGYIKKFLRTKAYIFCEKPACVTLKEFNYLKNLSLSDKRRIYINFNLRRSSYLNKLSEIISNKDLGKVINISSNLTYGIAFNSDFKKNWRANKSTIFDNISGNLGIHYINLFESLFGKSVDTKINLSSNISSNFFDTANILLRFNKNISSSIFLSYASPYSFNTTVHLTNGIVEFNNGKINLYHPRDTFNKLGLYVSPRKKVIGKFDNEFMNKSLVDSVNYFILKVHLKKNFLVKEFNDCIDSSYSLLNSEINPKF